MIAKGLEPVPAAREEPEEQEELKTAKKELRRPAMEWKLLASGFGFP